MEAAECMAAIKIGSCITSPLERSYETARIMLEKNPVTPVQVEGLQERHWGQLEGTSKQELDKYIFPEMGVEKWEDFVDRTVRVLSSLTYPPPVFIVAHSGTFRVICEFLNINIQKKPVRNAWPYRFFKQGALWQVEEIC